MRKFAHLSPADRAAAFEHAADISGLEFPIIEKDFWVCWMLDQLWRSPFAPHLLFKGGTSLSKCFGLIQRFSEDIDIGVDRGLLGFAGENDPLAPDLSRSARTRRVEALKAAAKEWIEGKFLDTLTAAITAELGAAEEAGWSWQNEPDTDGMPRLRWNPPVSHIGDREPKYFDLYLNRGVLIEIGARASHWPANRHTVMPYVAEQLPVAFSEPSTEICTLEATRTFWEKATILHVLNHETEADIAAGENVRARERFSRHYYDLHCIARSTLGEQATRDHDLLADVVVFKRTFFCSSTAKEAPYDDARPGTLRLVPHPALADRLAADYAKMLSSGMFFDGPPTWQAILESLHNLETQINGA